MQRDQHSEIIHVGLLIHVPIRLAGFESILSKLPNLISIHGSLESLLADQRIRLLVVDLESGGELPLLSGSAQDSLQLLNLIRTQRRDIQVLVLGQESDDELVMESIQAGARAFLDWTVGPLTLEKAIAEVIRGEIWVRRRVLSKLIDRLMMLADANSMDDSTAGEGDKNATRLTEREQQVVELILLARSNREIAKQLGIEESTVKSHVGRMMRKAGAENRIELSVWALQQVGRL